MEQEQNAEVVRVDGPPPPKPRLTGNVKVTDSKPSRIHRKEDLGGALLALVLLLAVLSFALMGTDHTTTEEVKAVFGDHLRNLLLIPLRLAEGLFLLASPIAVTVALARKRRFDSLIAVAITALVAGLITWGLALVLPHLPEVVQATLTTPDIGLVSLIAGLTIAGTGASSRAIRLSWYGVWFLLVLEVLQDNGTLTTLFLTFLFGRMIGEVARWAFGFGDLRASPSELVEAVLNIGIVPASISRELPEGDSSVLYTWQVAEQDDFAYGDVVLPLHAAEQGQAPTSDASIQPTRQGTVTIGADRRYRLVSTDGVVYDLDVLDPERGITNTLSELWSTFRLSGLGRWTSPSVKAHAERTVLTTKTAMEAGTRSRRPVALSEAAGSTVLVWQSLPPVASILDEDAADDLLDQAWTQLNAAHSRGVSHQNLDGTRLLVDEDARLWIVGWDQGDVGSSLLSRQVDCAQLLTCLALSVGPQRAVASAQKHLSAPQLAATAMALQKAILPPSVRRSIGRGPLLSDLREHLASSANTAPEQLEPLRLQRFSPKSVLIAVMLVIVVVSVLGSLNIDSIGKALADANPWWILVAFVIGLTPWFGSALSLKAFSGVKIKLWDATLAQVAASFVGVAAPAGIGPAGLNLRFLTRQGMTMPVAVATVTVLQVYHFITTITLLLLIVVISGTSVASFSFDAMTILWVAAGVIALLAALFAIPKVRKWVWGKVSPIWTQIAPELTRVLANPREMVVAFVGIIIVNAGFIGAFGASLAAFGHSLSFPALAVTFLLSNTAGSVIPTPGGIGPVEAALTGGLTLAGITAAVALSTAVVFRLVTFYIQVPIGWLALRVMQKRDLV